VAELASKGVIVEHVNTYYVMRALVFRKKENNILTYHTTQTLAMLKMQCPSLFIPTPKTFVRTVLAKITPGTIMQYWTHALVCTAMGLVPSKVVLAYMHTLLKDTRRRVVSKNKMQRSTMETRKLER
jgi:hypothetical protein